MKTARLSVAAVVGLIAAGAAAMAQNAVRYQTLLGALEKSMSLLRSAARDGRE